MENTDRLSAYGLNLFGSLIGVSLMFLSAFFGLLRSSGSDCVFWPFVCSCASPRTLFIGITLTITAIVTLAWPVNPLWNRVYSPYQLLESAIATRAICLFERGGTTTADSKPLTRRSWAYFRSYAPGNPDYYDLPYRFHTGPNEVAIVGAGAGNDVAAALRSGAQHVDAIEIDPAILLAGKMNHPEKPYDDPRVRPIVNDARSFLRNTKARYDMIVYGLLDSHTLLSAASSVRLDSFVYTIEGLREAREKLKDNGVLSLSLALSATILERKFSA